MSELTRWVDQVLPGLRLAAKSLGPEWEVLPHVDEVSDGVRLCLCRNVSWNFVSRADINEAAGKIPSDVALWASKVKDAAG